MKKLQGFRRYVATTSVLSARWTNSTTRPISTLISFYYIYFMAVYKAFLMTYMQ